MENKNKRKKSWKEEEVRALLEEALEMRIYQHIDGKRHKNKDVSSFVNRFVNSPK